MSAPVEMATARGHTVEYDQPAINTRAERWTCTRCGLAVLRFCGNIYGSATEQDCEGT